MAKKEKEVYYDAQGNPVEPKKKSGMKTGCLAILACIGIFITFIVIGSLFTNPNEEEEPETTEEVAEKEVVEEETETSEEVTTEEEVETEAPEPVETEAPEPVEEEEEETESEDTGDVSREFEAALQSAESYNEFMPMSKAGLYQQLTSDAGDGYPAEAAQYAIDNVDIDYKENAVKSANNYNELMPMSDQELLDQLTSEAGDGYTMEEAQYALENMDK